MTHFIKPNLLKPLIIILLASLGLVFVVILTKIDYGCDWTGFGHCITQKQEDTEVRPSKTLWDWMNLLIVPFVLAIGGILYSRVEKQIEQNRNDENIQETVLSTYLERISSLLLENNLGDEDIHTPARDVALGWTMMVMPRLNGRRKGVALQFLYGSNLLNKENPILTLGDVNLDGISLNAWLEGIYLNGASMKNADLEGCYLWGSDLSATYLEGANLEKANLGEINLENAFLEGANLKTFSISGNLKGVRLKNADLRGTDLSCVDLSEADLEGAKVTQEQLSQALSLENAILPDGSKSNLASNQL